MTSSPVSNFKFSRRRLLFLSAQKAAVYHWHNGRPGSSYLFDVHEEGRVNFERYLREAPNTPMHILVDIFDEEYRRDTIPHVYGPDRTAILERKKSRLFRDTSYQYTKVQGREEGGRRDDRILLSAITNPGVVDQWTALLEKYKVPLEGIHSLPLFTESLLGEIPGASDYMLIVSMQSISGLRQTFFQNREFRISRLVQMPRYGTVPYAPYIEEEIEKIHRYLSSLRLISLDAPLDIYFFLAGGLLEELREHYRNSSLIKYHFLDINEMAGKAGFPTNLNTPFCDQYFAYQFLKKRQPNCYATAANRRYSSLRRMKIAMLAASLLLVLSGFIWSGLNFLDGLTLKQNSIAAENKANFYQTRYDVARGRMPKTPVEPVDLKIAVDISATLKEYHASPLATMRVLSRGLNQFPVIKLDSLEWTVSLNPDPVSTGNPAAPVSTAAAFTPGNGAASYRYYHITEIAGHLEPFDGDFRKALETINEFVGFIKGIEMVHDVSVMDMPLDISSTANLQGNTQIVQNEAKFALRVVIGVGDEA